MADFFTALAGNPSLPIAIVVLIGLFLFKKSISRKILGVIKAKIRGSSLEWAEDIKILTPDKSAPNAFEATRENFSYEVYLDLLTVSGTIMLMAAEGRRNIIHGESVDMLPREDIFIKRFKYRLENIVAKLKEERPESQKTRVLEEKMQAFELTI